MSQVNPLSSLSQAPLAMNDYEYDFLKFYLEQTWLEMRHIETLRERVTILVVTLASAIMGFIVQQKFSSDTLPLAMFICVLGVFGGFMVTKLYQLHQKDQCRLDVWYVYYESFCQPNSQILFLRNEADKDSNKKFWIHSWKHNYFWLAIHIFIVIGGLLMLTRYHNASTSSIKVKIRQQIKTKNNYSAKKETVSYQDTMAIRGKKK